MITKDFLKQTLTYEEELEGDLNKFLEKRQSCLEALNKIHKFSSLHPQQAIYTKYSTPKYGNFYILIIYIFTEIFSLFLGTQVLLSFKHQKLFQKPNPFSSHYISLRSLRGLDMTIFKTISIRN